MKFSKRGDGRGGRGGRGGGTASRSRRTPIGLAAEPRLADVVSYGVAVAVAITLRQTGVCPTALCSGGILDTAAAIVVPLGSALAVGWRLSMRFRGRRDGDPSSGAGGPPGPRGGGPERAAPGRPVVKRRRTAAAVTRDTAPASARDAEDGRSAGGAVVVPSMWPQLPAPIETAERPRDAD